MRIEDPDDRGRKLLEFVQVGALSHERFEFALGYSERAGHRSLTIVRMKDLDQHDRPFAWQTNLAGNTPPPGLGWREEAQHSCSFSQDL